MTVYTRPNGDDKNDRIEKTPVKSQARNRNRKPNLKTTK